MISLAPFERRLAQHARRLAKLFVQLYGDDSSVRDEFDLLLGDLEASRGPRRRLRALDDTREANRGLVCLQPDARRGVFRRPVRGLVAGIRSRIPYFVGELTEVHLMPRPTRTPGIGRPRCRATARSPRWATANSRASAELGKGSLVLDSSQGTSSGRVGPQGAAGDPEFTDFYLIYPDRHRRMLRADHREIFPDDHPGSFVPLPDGRWVWATLVLPVGSELPQPRSLRDGPRDGGGGGGGEGGRGTGRLGGWMSSLRCCSALSRSLSAGASTTKPSER